jgi:hypothetical protein
LATEISAITHPEYKKEINNWVKYRLTMEGGQPYIDKYLKKFTDAEGDTEYRNRKQIAYVPKFAAANILEIRNAIFQRIVEVTRKDGPTSYTHAMRGDKTGVDNKGSSMNQLIGQVILPELLSMKKIGILIDAPGDRGQTLAEITTPYLIVYKAEEIRSWTISNTGELTAVLLSEKIYTTDAGLPSGTENHYRLLRLTDAGVEYTVYNAEGVIETGTLNYKKIPFVLFELTDSLLKDVADYQRTLLNIASSDTGFLLKANVPIYTEMVDSSVVTPFIRDAEVDSDGNDPDTKTKKVGTDRGVQYGRGLDRPAFIGPPPEIIATSISKQNELKLEIRQLMHLAVTSIEPKSQSAESKSMDARGLEAGLSYIALVLQKGEQLIADFWAMIENFKDPGTVKYPERYSLRTEEEIRLEVEKIRESVKSTPSLTAKKELWKRMADLELGARVTNETLETIYKEIDAITYPFVDIESVIEAHKEGLVGDETASLSLGYAEGEHEKAQQDHAERATRILAAQVSGMPDLDTSKKDNGETD